MTSTSQDDFVAWWAKQVATKFDLDESSIASCYSENDTYNTDSNMRSLWKYATAKGVNGTPSAFVNGVKLDTVPMTVDDWLTVLNSVYNSQYGIVSAVEKYIQN